MKNSNKITGKNQYMTILQYNENFQDLTWNDQIIGKIHWYSTTIEGEVSLRLKGASRNIMVPIMDIELTEQPR